MRVRRLRPSRGDNPASAVLGDVDLWLAPLGGSQRGVELGSELLSTAEMARFDRIVDESARRRRILARSALRVVLGRYLATDAASIALAEGRDGKPVLAGGGPAFNLAHSGELAAIAVGPSLVAVGIDIEVAGRRAGSRLPLRALAPTEAATLGDLQPATREEAFLRYWTAKEAYAKGLGKGLGKDLRTVEIRHTASGPTLSSSGGGWRLAYFDPLPGVIGAVATREQGRGWRG